MSLTQERLRDLLSYDPDTGVFIRKSARKLGLVGKPAGSRHCCGYRAIVVGAKTYLAHRLAWMYVYGKWPDNEIDHINRDRSDNRICNLRSATRHENSYNVPKLIKNKSGYKGVSKHPLCGKFVAQTTINNKKQYIGLFETAEEASEAYRIATEYRGDFRPLSDRGLV